MNLAFPCFERGALRTRLYKKEPVSRMNCEHAWTDRLVDFCRHENRVLIEELEEIRRDVAEDRRAELMVKVRVWQRALSTHFEWEDDELLAAYGKRCPASDLPNLAVHERDHAALLGETEDVIGALHDGSLDNIRDLLGRLELRLLEHRNQEVNEFCSALDHVLDAPTIASLEKSVLLH